MDAQIIGQIRKYIQEQYIGGGIIAVPDVSRYCSCSDETVIEGLTELEELGEVKIVRRYFCYELHHIREFEYPYCSECNDDCPESLIDTYYYFKPLSLGTVPVASGYE